MAIAGLSVSFMEDRSWEIGDGAEGVVEMHASPDWICPVIPFIMFRTFTPAIKAKRLRLLSRMVPALVVDWDLAVNGETPFRIAPLQ